MELTGFYNTFKTMTSRSSILNDDVIWRRTDKILRLGSAIFDFVTYKTPRNCQNYLNIYIFLSTYIFLYLSEFYHYAILSWTQFRKACLFNLKKRILQIGLTASFKFASLWNFDHPLIFVFNPQSWVKLPRLLDSYSFSVPTKGSTGQPIQQTAIFKERMIYIASGIGFILLLVLCFVLGFWRYRRSHHKRIKRLFTVVVILPTIKRNKFICRFWTS